MMLNLTRFEEFVRSIAIDDGYAGWEYEDGESMVNDAVAWLAAHDALAAEVGRLITKIRDLGITVLLVEHDMSLVMDISDEIVVLSFGQKIAEDLPPAIQKNPEVIKIYLGE